MKDWKSILLETDYFVNNEYLDLYIELVSCEHKTASYMEKHHIIPVSYYKNKYNIANDKQRHAAERQANADPQNEIVILSFAEHCKAHWLLAKCTIEPLATANAVAVMRQTAGIQSVDNKVFFRKNTRSIIEVGLTEEEYEVLQRYIEDIKSSSQRFWSQEQDAWLKQNRYLYTVSQCAEILGKTESAIRSRCKVLKLQKVWHTEEENEEFLKYSETHTAQECADHFGMSKHNVVKRWRDLGFSKTFKWTEEMDNWLRENDTKYTVAELAEQLGTTKTIVMGRRWKLGITRWERHTK